VVAYQELRDAIDYVRRERKPFLLEAMVSRLYGHSSASGANFVSEEVDCIVNYEQWLEAKGVADRAHFNEVRKRWNQEMAELARKVRDEPQPSPDSIWNFIFAEKK
jgi:2-oxoisovalerate dehydrogenase E1 component alpha subunit